MAENAEKTEKKEKKKSHTGRNVTIGVIAALLLSLGGYFGFGGGNGFGFSGNGTADVTSGAQQSETGKKTGEDAQAPAQAEEKTDEKAENEGSKVIVITVSEDKITVDGESVEEAGLEAALAELFTGEAKVELRDDHAIKATFDEVEALLAKLDIPYEKGE